jgi:hypothetical protein
MELKPISSRRSNASKDRPMTVAGENFNIGMIDSSTTRARPTSFAVENLEHTSSTSGQETAASTNEVVTSSRSSVPAVVPVGGTYLQS